MPPRSSSLTADPSAVLPSELVQALASDPMAGVSFARLAPSHRKEYVQWIGFREET